MSEGHGGGISNSGHVTLTNSTLAYNASLSYGAGLSNRGVLTLTNSTLAYNASQNAGGGIYSDGLATLTNSTLAANTATLFGGGITNVGTLTLTNSMLSGNISQGTGGGVLNSSTLTLTNSTLFSNSSQGIGGGIHNYFGTTTLTNTALSANSGSAGGGIANNEGTISLTNSTLSGNFTTNGQGGGIDNENGTVTLMNSTLTGNSAPNSNGGGIVINGGTLTVTNSMFIANSATIGGGIQNNGGMVTATNSTFSTNSATFVGGGIYNNSMLTVTNSTLSTNSSQSDGGGIYNQGMLLLANSTLSANISQNVGGGIINLSTATLTNVTLAANSANAGGGLYIETGSDVELYNTIIAGNKNSYDATLPDDISGTSNIASANNLIGDPARAGGLTHGTNGNIVGKDDGAAGRVLLPLAEILDPMLRNNGGPTLTYALAAGSAAIDAGDDSHVAAIPFDQRGPGFPRVLGASSDIGAFEMPAALLSDDYNRGNSATLGAAWLNRVGALGIVGGAAQGSAATPVHVAMSATVITADIDLYASVALQNGQSAGLLARYGGIGDKNYYLGSLSKDAAGNITAKIIRNVNGAAAELAVVEDVASVVGALHFRVLGTSLQLFLGTTLLASVQDTAFRSGGIGIRTIGATAVDNFQARPLVTGADQFESFTLPNNTTLGEQWSNVAGYYRTVNQQLQGGQPNNQAVLSGVRAADVDVSATLSVTGLYQSAGLVARYSGVGDANYYLARLARTNTGFVAQLFRNLGGTYVLLTSANVASATGKANLRFLVTGTNLQVFVNSVPVINALDAMLAVGSVGIRSDNAALIDDFRVAAVTTTLPFSDSFKQPDNSLLSDNWTRRVGVFAARGGAAVAAAAGVNLSTLVGVRQANVEVRADLALSALNDQFSLLARYSGTADTNYYAASVLRTVSGYTLSIVRNVGGTVTVLKSLNVAALTGTLAFRVVGTSLTLSINGVLQLSAADAVLTTGSVGIRGIGTGRLDNFTAAAV